ncbi:circadian-associated transcriptional repressor, partial [Ornithorhynchus anatinus]|uniref:circadian-associated transcriptional repressor n=1 Tax=Ornithorhynchus anatinus TaxID=9258 RepID=UPI0019D49B95
RRRPPGPGGGPEGPEPPGSRGGDGVRAGGRGPATEGDRLFARKCQELQGFIQPLTDLLNGLKMGRYEKGLSSFQQSVAMDRIQRIVGVLRKPEMGERYLGTLLQVEVMLKVWFPHVAPRNRRRPAKAAGGPREKPPAAQTPAPRPDRSRLLHPEG